MTNSITRIETKVRIAKMKSETHFNIVRSICYPMIAGAAIVTATITLTKLFL